MNTGDRVAWWSQPKRKLGRCTGTVLGVRRSSRTGEELVVEGDPTGKQIIVRPSNLPVLLRCYRDLKEGDRVRLPATEEFEELVGTVHTELADGFLYLFLEAEQDISEVPVEDELDEVEWLDSGEGRG